MAKQNNYDRYRALNERAWDLLASRLWPLDPELLRTRAAIFLAHNWIACDPNHPAHAEYERIIARHWERLEQIDRAYRTLRTRKAPSVQYIDRITEYGMTTVLSNPIRVF